MTSKTLNQMNSAQATARLSPIPDKSSTHQRRCHRAHSCRETTVHICGTAATLQEVAHCIFFDIYSMVCHQLMNFFPFSVFWQPAFFASHSAS